MVIGDDHVDAGGHELCDRGVRTCATVAGDHQACTGGLCGTDAGRSEIVAIGETIRDERDHMMGTQIPQDTRQQCGGGHPVHVIVTVHEDGFLGSHRFGDTGHGPFSIVQAPWAFDVLETRPQESLGGIHIGISAIDQQSAHGLGQQQCAAELRDGLVCGLGCGHPPRIGAERLAWSGAAAGRHSHNLRTTAGRRHPKRRSHHLHNARMGPPMICGPIRWTYTRADQASGAGR